MEGSFALEFTAIVLLVLANGFFALAEFSIIASKRNRLRERINDKKFGAEKAFALYDNPENFLATIQVGITLFGAMLGVFSGDRIVDKLAPLFISWEIPLLTQYAEPVALGSVVLLITILSVLFGELIPKYVALSNPEVFAGIVAGPVAAFIKMTSFLSRFLSWLARAIIGLFGIRRDPTKEHISEEEINQMIHEGTERGVFDQTEQKLIRSAFTFSDSTVRRAMRPRTDVVAVNQDDPIERILRLVTSEGYSRYPVFSGTIDHVVGVLNVKDLLYQKQQEKPFDLKSLLRQPMAVPDSMPLASLLVQFQRGKNHMAIVLDEFGGTAGIITLEDILEELVGEIQDEHDTETPPFVKESESVATADGAVWPGEINQQMNTDLPEDIADTLAGLYMDEAGRLPLLNESVRIADVKLTVIAKDRNRIKRIRIEKLAEEASGE